MDWGFPVGVIASVGSPGLFAFWTWDDFQSVAFEFGSNLFSPSSTEELRAQSLECSVWLIASQMMQADRSGD